MSIQLVKSINNEVQEFHLDEKKIDLIKRTICKGASDEELELFVHACKRSGLDPFMRQIFAVKRWDSSQRREVMSIQTGIDGYRLIADRTGRYSPGQDTEFGYDEQGSLRFAKAYVKKMTPDGNWHEISATAFWDEYVQTTKEGRPTIFWQKKGHIMLSKCAETLALRKAFPAELSGLYTQEEMGQDMNTHVSPTAETKKKIEKISKQEVEEIEEKIGDDNEFYDQLLSRLKRAFGCSTFADLPSDQFRNVVKVIDDHNFERVQYEIEEEEQGKYEEVMEG